MDNRTDFGKQVLEDTLEMKNNQLASYNILVTKYPEKIKFKEAVETISQQIAELKNSLEVLYKYE